MDPKDCSGSVDDLTEGQMKTLHDWEEKFRSKYPEVGKVGPVGRLLLVLTSGVLCACLMICSFGTIMVINTLQQSLRVAMSLRSACFITGPGWDGLTACVFEICLLCLVMICSWWSQRR